MAQFAFKVTRNGQITIPKPIRDRFHVQEGDTVFFEVEDDRVVLRFFDSNPISVEEAEAMKRSLEQLLEGESIEYADGMYRKDAMEGSPGKSS